MAALGWAALVFAFAWMLLAAKAHGRQLRLERELMGVAFTDFRHPPPELAALWGAERRRFWPQVAAYAVVLGVVAVVGDLFAVRMNLADGTPGWPRIVSGAGVAFVLAMALAFLVTGLLSLGRLRRAAAPRMEELWRTRGAWLNLALRGSAALWGVVVAFGLVVGALLFA